MAVTIPVIITNKELLVKRKGKNEFLSFSIESAEHIPNVPFYHYYAKKLDESINIFKDFIKAEYGVLLSKPIIALVLPDDTTELERAFLQSFFLNVGKSMAISYMSQILSNEMKYVSLSKTGRTIALQYICDGEILAERYYDSTSYDVEQIGKDIRRIHIDADAESTPIFINNLSGDMIDFFGLGDVIMADNFRRTVCDITLEKAKN